ncbi:Hypothetical predicted protein [Prunus dulcis]|uniref:TIR domain-containing protein n=1 Tax=Prunus dulcis TaxID=3755 RepID=A0A5E4EWZ9_PRUDU|nr:Hypothetical predicted protein [Prunus dulcis]
MGVGWCVRRASLLLNAGLSFSDKTIVNIRLPRETKHMLTKNTTKDIIGDELGEAVGGDGGEDETAAALTLGSGKSRSRSAVRRVERMRSKASFWQTEEAGCLRELEKIMERRRTRGQMVLPIFYDVDPKDVGKQTVKDCNWEEMMQSWRKSLIEAANLSGLVSTETDG